MLLKQSRDMKVENIMMTEDLAEKIDNLLKQASPPKMQAIAPVTNDTELNEYIAIGNLLENMGYARRLGGQHLHGYIVRFPIC